MIRTLKSLAALAKVKISSAMIYRVSFFSASLSDCSLFLVQLLFLQLLTAGSSGWDQNMTAMFVGSFTALDGLYMATWFFGVISLPDRIRTGELDHILLKPLNALLYISFDRIDLGSIPVLLLGLIMTFSGAHAAGCLTPLNVFLWVLAILVMYLLMYALSMLLRSIAFWTKSTNAFGQIEGELVTYSFRLPLPAITGAWKFVLLMALPYGLVANFPTIVLAGQAGALHWLYALLLTAAFFLFFLCIWKKGLKRYESASS